MAPDFLANTPLHVQGQRGSSWVMHSGVTDMAGVPFLNGVNYLCSD